MNRSLTMALLAVALALAPACIPRARKAPRAEPMRGAPISVEASSGVWTGKWDTNFGAVYLNQYGDRVDGSYPCCGGGTIRGVVQGSRLVFEWVQPDSSGRGVFFLDAHGQAFSGTWGTGSSDTSGGAWNGTRG